MAIELNRDNFETEILQAKEPLVIDFWGPRCQPCLSLMPAVEKFEQEYAGKIKVAKVNAEQNRMLCARLRVLGLPSFLFYHHGVEVKRLSGQTLTGKEIKEAIEALVK
jgi:thioredoxin 1